MRRTKTQWIAALAWSIKDAREALSCALAMDDWSGVRKYTAQIERFQSKLVRAACSCRRRDMTGLPGVPAGWIFGQGRLP